MNLIEYARLYCSNCNRHCYLTKEEYDVEMNQPDYTWRCKNCGQRDCDFDDDYWEKNVGVDRE